MAALRERILATHAPVFLRCDKNDRAAHQHNAHVLHLWGVGMRDIHTSLRGKGDMNSPNAGRMRVWGPTQDENDVRVMSFFLDMSGYELDDLRTQRLKLGRKAFAPIALATAMGAQRMVGTPGGYALPEGPRAPKPGRSSHRRKGRPS